MLLSKEAGRAQPPGGADLRSQDPPLPTNNTPEKGGIVYSELAQRALRHLERVERSRNTIPPHPLYTTRTAELEALTRGLNSHHQSAGFSHQNEGLFTGERFNSMILPDYQQADARNAVFGGSSYSRGANTGWPYANYGRSSFTSWPAYYLPSDHYFPCLHCKNCWTHPFHHCFHRHHNL